MDIGEVRRVIRVAPEPFPMGNPAHAPKEPAPVLVPAWEPEREEVPA